MYGSRGGGVANPQEPGVVIDGLGFEEDVDGF